METSVLDDIIKLVEERPQGGPALVLFALMKTLSMEKGQYLFLLNKLRDLEPQHRQLAYRLMELMADGGNQGPEWTAAVDRIEAKIRGF